MNIKKAFIPLLIVPVTGVMAEHSPTHQLDEMVITTGHKLFPNTTKATTSFDITTEDINKTNLFTASDAIKLAPSVHVRRRFIGDTNGVTAIRGSTNFQTNHFNMFLDGIPLHNPVQTKWNGAPKWSLIAPNALHSATVFYGPYSAEHRPAFGGTFDLKTQLPEEFEMHMDVAGMVQDSHRYGVDEILTGHKEFISAGNRVGDFSFFGFYNHIENEGQAQQWGVNDSPGVDAGGNTAVTGAQTTQTTTGDHRIITGDKGINEVLTDLYSFKVGYDINPDLRALFTVAFEDTERSNQSRTYLKDANGNPVWSGTSSQGGFQFDPNPASWFWPTLGGSENERQTLMYGFNLSGKVSEDWSIDTTASYFDAYKDKTVENKVSFNDPAWQTDKSGRIKETDVWWVDYMAKVATQSFFGRDDLGFMAGFQFNNSYLDINQWNSDNVTNEEKTSLRDHDGGSTTTYSTFMQTDWDALDNLNVMAGVRYDHWATSRGTEDKVGLADRDESRVSPKAHISFTPIDDFNMKYSFTKAYRFAVAEELFDSTNSAGSANISDPNLKPESGYFHDVSFQYELDGGYTRATFFYNEIENEIMNITTVAGGGGTNNRTRGVDETETVGIELVYNQDYILGFPFGINANGTWINKEIKKDSNNPDLVNKEWLRIPKYRAHVTGTYHMTPNWDAITMVDYRSRQFSQADNSDTVDNVYGSSDAHVLVNFKMAYSMDVGNDMTTKFSVGVENILDENIFDHHPYPQRTYTANISLDI